MSAAEGFDGSANFDIDPDASIVTEFNRLALQNNWKKKSSAYKKNRARLVKHEFDALFGANLSNLQSWQRICQAVGITDIPSSVTQCKKVSSRTKNSRRMYS
jgi:hypothetical protein